MKDSSMSHPPEPQAGGPRCSNPLDAQFLDLHVRLNATVCKYLKERSGKMRKPGFYSHKKQDSEWALYKAACNEMPAQSKYNSTTPFHHYNTPHIT